MDEQEKPERDGATRRNDGRWMGRITLADGKRKAVYGPSKTAVLKKIHKLQADQDAGLPVVSDRRTVAQFLNEWLETVRPRLQPTTYARYEQFVRRQLIPELGRVKLARLTPHQVQNVYSKWREAGLSPTSVKHMHTVLHNALGQAVRWGYAARNVSDLVDKPRPAVRQMRTLTREQVDRLLEAVVGDRLEALYVLALSTGLRQGELLALQWSYVDLERGSLQVRGTVQPVKGGLRISEPKTKSSRRRVLLAPRAVDALRRHRTAQKAERLQMGAAWEDMDLVFPNGVGRPMRAGDLLKRSFHPLLDRARLPRFRFHELRHTAATLQSEAGTPAKVVQEMLGHSTIAITLDLYGHVTPTMQERAAEVANDILGGVRR